MACKPQVSMQPFSVSFGELDDLDWVSLYPDERGGCSTISPVQSPRKVEGSSEIQAYPGSSLSAPFVEVLDFTKKFPKDEVLATVEKTEGKLSTPLQASYERRKRLRKRKSFIVSDDNEELKKQEALRQRKKAYVGELERKVGTMTSAIAELNSTINLISTENVNVRNQLAYLYHAPGTSINSGTFISPNRMPAVSSVPSTGATGARPVRAKRSKFSKREKEGPLKELWKFRKAANVVLVAFLCIMMLFFPVRLGMQGIGNFFTSRTSMKWVEDGNSISHHAQWPVFMDGSPPVHSGTLREGIPRYVQGMEGSSHPGMGTEKAGCKEGTTAHLHISGPQNASDPRNGTIGGNKSQNIEESKLMDADAGAVRQSKPGTSKAEGESGSMQQWGSSGTIFSSGKCTEVFQYKIASDASSYVGGIPVVNRMIRGNKHPKAQNDKSSSPLKLQKKQEASSSMVVSILPRKSAGRSGEIFVVVAIDGVKYVTYSCTLSQQILPS